MAFKSSALEPRWLMVALFFIAGMFLGGLSVYLWAESTIPLAFKIHASGKNGYKYINPLLAVDVVRESRFAENKILTVDIESILDKAKQNNKITNASFYFRDIEPGVWAGINEEKKFSPGRLLKIPIMITYFKLAEVDPTVLDQSLIVSKNEVDSNTQLFALHEPIQADSSYSVMDLITRMIVDSDNSAAIVLFDNIDTHRLDEVFSDLGVDFKEDKITPDFISLKLYSIFFRILYNATYLNREYSEKALELLVQGDNSIGLGALLPKDVAFANRFGARKLTNNGQQDYEMYDCGVVFYPSHPYLVCGTIQGPVLADMEKTMEQIGRKVYEELDYQYAGGIR